LIDSLGGILLGDVGEMSIDGGSGGTAVAKNPLDVAEA